MKQNKTVEVTEAALELLIHRAREVSPIVFKKVLNKDKQFTTEELSKMILLIGVATSFEYLLPKQDKNVS